MYFYLSYSTIKRHLNKHAHAIYFSETPETKGQVIFWELSWFDEQTTAGRILQMEDFSKTVANTA